jgi:nitroreductase
MTTRTDRTARTDHPVHELVARRWSPHAFADREVSKKDLLSLFEAARWAPSSYNEQPWSFLLATRDDEEEYARILSCLVEPNQVWARTAPVLVLTVASLTFRKNGKPNRVALHDLGLAAATLTLEASSRGIHVHQMAGILPDRARELFSVPDGFEVETGIAIGYPEEPGKGPEELRPRDTAARDRKKLAELVFRGKWGETSPAVK